MRFKRPCLDCGQLTELGNRCQYHQRIYQAKLDERKNKDHYKGNYTTRAKKVRETASVCWICKQGPIPNDPWTADHVIPGQADSPLLPAHRSCNSRRGNKIN